MSLTKEEYLNAYEIIDTLLHLMCGEERADGYEPSMEEMVKSMEAFNSLIREHFDNSPLEFEELKENMWVWDNKEKMFCKIVEVLSFDKLSVDYHYTSILEFEENRFYRKEVENEKNREIF